MKEVFKCLALFFLPEKNSDFFTTLSLKKTTERATQIGTDKASISGRIS